MNEQELLRQLQERRKLGKKTWLDAIRGCLIGGAAGDALGYPVEFLPLREIRSRYGAEGITAYQLDSESGKALISDDTQMTLFTAHGILCGATYMALRGIAEPVESYVQRAYRDWLSTQTGGAQPSGQNWLVDIPALNASRAPGSACIAALAQGRQELDSKGCGGVMRVAPVALYFQEYSSGLPLLGGRIAAITHGHPLGYMPAAALTYILHGIVYGCPDGQGTLNALVDACCGMLEELYAKTPYLEELLAIIRLAQTLSGNAEDDAENIAQLGQGWVAEEALAIALYCSLKYEDDFSAAIIAAVNHGGDSDSTGSITGNIMGARIGYERIPQKWKDHLELHDTIIEVANDVCYDCQVSEYSSNKDKNWLRKYGGSAYILID